MGAEVDPPRGCTEDAQAGERGQAFRPPFSCPRSPSWTFRGSLA